QVAGQSNEMFSDFRFHNIGVPQLAPGFGVGKGDFRFDGPGKNEDYGLENITLDPNDRYKFRTSPLRNLKYHPSFFHDGAFTNHALAIAHHLDVINSARAYTPAQNKVPKDLWKNRPPVDNVLANLDPLVQQPILLSEAEFKALVAFVRDGLYDPKDDLQS